MNGATEDLTSRAKGDSDMLHTRPASATGDRTSAFPSDPDSRSSGADNHVHAMLQKIGLLAARYERNVAGLIKLRKCDTSSRPNYEEVPHVRGRKTPRSTFGFEVQNGCRMRPNLNGRVRHSQNPGSFTRATANDGRLSVTTTTKMEPFRTMEAHATAWKRKVKRREEEEAQAKKQEEELQARDRERFILSVTEGAEFSGVIARSNEMVERRRKRMAEAEAKEAESMRRCKFKARPVHITDEDWNTIQERQATRRKQRAKLRKEQMASRSHLPRRMAMHELHRAATAAGMADREAKGAQGKRAMNSTSTADRLSIPHDQIRQVLAARQRLWDRRLAAAKVKKENVIPQVYPMQERDKIYKQRAQQRTQHQLEKLSNAREREEEEKRRRQAKAFIAPVPLVPRTTNSVFMKMKKVQHKLMREADDARRKAERQRTWRHRQSEIGRSLSAVINRINRQQGRQARRQTDEEIKLRAREYHRKYRTTLSDNKAKMDQATEDRPTLWERHDAHVRKEAAKRIALSTIAEKAFPSGVIAMGGANQTKRSTADKIFDDEERAALGISLF